MSEEAEPVTSSWQRWLVLYVRFIGGFSLLAFAASVMPARWMIEIGEELGIDPFPDSPLTFYLARNLSLLYGFVGATLLVITSDMRRYGSLVWYVARGTVLFGILQMIVNTISGLPLWWTFGESISTILGGVLMWWLDAKATSSKSHE